MVKKCSCSIGRMVLTESRNDSIAQNMTSSMESNWVTELGTLQCLGEEIIPLPIMTILFMVKECSR